MAYTTLADFRTMILEVYKRTDKTTEIDRAINEAYREMIAVTHPRKLKDQIYHTCTINREEYPLAEDVLRINHPIRLIDTSSDTNNASAHGPLEFIDKAEYDIREPNPNATTIVAGKPDAYCIWKNSILLTPLPDKAYRIEVNIGGEGTALSAATDETIFQPTWDETHKAGALSRLFVLIGLKEEADIWQSIYRWGFAGKEGKIAGGLEQLEALCRAYENAPFIVRNNNL